METNLKKKKSFFFNFKKRANAYVYKSVRQRRNWVIDKKDAKTAAMDVANVRDALSGAHFSGWHPSSTSSSSSSSSPPQPPSHPPFVIGIYTITTHLLLSSHFYNYFFSSVCLVHWLRMLLFLRNQTALQSSRFSSTLSIWLNIQHLASPRIRTYMRTYLFDFFF